MKICYTLDLEGDHDGVCSPKAFEALKSVHPLEALIREQGIRLTCFVTGEILDSFPDLIRKWQTMGIEFECHSYSHPRHPEADRGEEIVRSFETYLKIFNKRPLGYRAPFGLISPEQFRILYDLGFKYDSSIIPASIPGQWSNRRYPSVPYPILQNDGDLIEIPASVLPIIRIPLSLGFIQFFGWPFYFFIIKLMNRLGTLPKVIIFGFHLHDLFKTPNLNHLPNLTWRIYYLSNRLKRCPFKTFERVTSLFREIGYESVHMSQLVQEIQSSGKAKMGAQRV